MQDGRSPGRSQAQGRAEAGAGLSSPFLIGLPLRGSAASARAVRGVEKMRITSTSSSWVPNEGASSRSGPVHSEHRHYATLPLYLRRADRHSLRRAERAEGGLIAAQVVAPLITMRQTNCPLSRLAAHAALALLLVQCVARPALTMQVCTASKFDEKNSSNPQKKKKILSFSVNFFLLIFINFSNFFLFFLFLKFKSQKF